VPVIGSALSAIEGWLLGQLTDVAFENRDGVVAAELRAMMGRDLYALTGNGQHPLTVTTTHRGADIDSLYDVTWSITPL
jgi:hypothetical protein